jgi:hypothetical protein
MRSFSGFKAALMGGSICAALCAMPTSALAQVSSINSAQINPRVFNDVPGATLTTVNAYPGLISFNEANVSTASGFANRDVWYFSNNGGTSAYTFQNNDFFSASFGVTLTGGTTGFDLEAGILFSNPSGSFGGDLQSIEQGNGQVVQFGGPSFYPFSPAAGGPPAQGSSPPGGVPNYVEGQKYIFGIKYLIDPNTALPALEYSVDPGTGPVFALSSAGDPFFDLGGPLNSGPGSNSLGGYFQIGNDSANPNQTGKAVFSNISITPITVPEPASLSMLAIGGVTLLGRRRAKKLV